ncbi:MraY family glycosyltransferase [Pinibacter soli]|uniref:MraY family glycosyltransferase n=1 Tax=Pinibacter soli TaxID=3044211 RepID=A0ABT6RIF3_9BACT|nr:MraY family glycosyltransferase [Pinibacter soli]MDI3322344.1 MraY family glycosyltransferase [Pinibacter soli]
MLDVILSLSISFAVSYLAIPIIIKVAKIKKLYDVPDERKVHVTPIPSLGGLGIFAGFVFGCMLSTNFGQSSEMQYFIAATLVIFFLGIKDDILILSPIKKFIGQVLAAFIVIYKGGIQINSMHGFLGINELPEMYSLLLTYFTILVVINSFNLIDGIDGLAGSLGLMVSALVGIYMLQVGELAYAILAFSLAGALVAFLLFNFQPAKIFMGDTGSLLIGLINSILVIKFINISESSTMPMSSGPAIGIALLFIPLLDTLRVFSIRMFKKRSPFSPDRNHIHHLLLDRGLSHRNIVLTLVSSNIIAIIAAAYFSLSVSCTLLVLAISVAFFVGIGILQKTKRPRLFVANLQNGTVESNAISTKIVPLTKDSVLEQK